MPRIRRARAHLTNYQRPWSLSSSDEAIDPNTLYIKTSVGNLESQLEILQCHSITFDQIRVCLLSDDNISDDHFRVLRERCRGVPNGKVDLFRESEGSVGPAQCMARIPTGPAIYQCLNEPDDERWLGNCQWEKFYRDERPPHSGNVTSSKSIVTICDDCKYAIQER